MIMKPICGSWAGRCAVRGGFREESGQDGAQEENRGLNNSPILFSPGAPFCQNFPVIAGSGFLFVH